MAITERWKTHIEVWQASGLPQAEDCRRHGLNANTFSGRPQGRSCCGMGATRSGFRVRCRRAFWRSCCNAWADPLP